MRRTGIIALVALTIAAAASAATAPTIRGTARADRITAVDGKRQRITCGRGIDVVNADLVDRVRADCEIVARRIARDTTTAAEAQHATIVEPDAASVGNTVVTAFQSGRVPGGGAATIGWASSRDGGRTWRSGTLPGVGHASDPTVAYDAIHRVWLVVTLGITNGPTSIDVSRSADGRTWSAPGRPLAASTSAFDKQWIFCDNYARSPRRGTCYVAYSDLRLERIALVSSTDGGVTWSTPVGVGPRGDVVDGQPATLPDGTLVVTWVDRRTILAARSRDGGATFEPPVEVAEVSFAATPGLRAPPLPALDLDYSGRLLLAWPDCRFRAGCSGNDIVLSASRDGISWGSPTRVTSGTANYSTVGLATLPLLGDQAGGFNGIVVVTQALPRGGAGTVGIAAAVTRDGRRWSPTRRLDARTMRLSWLPVAPEQRFLGDYLAAAWVGRRALAIAPIASPQPRFNQALYAAEVR